MSKTKDGYTVTNFIQDGPSVGTESKRVFVRRADRTGFEWWQMNTIDEARIFVDNAHRFTRTELVADLDDEGPHYLSSSKL